MTWSYVCGLCGTNSAFEYFTLKNENCQNKIISGNELNKDTSLTIETDKERTDAHFKFMKNAFYYSNTRSLMFEGNWEVNI